MLCSNKEKILFLLFLQSNQTFCIETSKSETIILLLLNFVTFPVTTIQEIRFIQEKLS